MDQAVTSAGLTWGGWILGLLALIVPAIQQIRRGKIDESTLLLDKWKELAAAVQDASGAQVKQLEKEVAEQRVEITALHVRLDESLARNEILLRMLTHAALERPIQLTGPEPTERELDILKAIERAREHYKHG